MRMIHVASGGALVDKTHAQPRDLITTMVANSPQFGVRQESKHVNEVKTTNVEQQVSNLTQCVQTLATTMNSLIKPYGICSL